MIAGPRYFAALAGRLHWDPETLDLAADAARWPGLDGARRERLTALLAGFCVAEYRVADELAPFARAAGDPALAAVFDAQRDDERRHYRFFDRIAELILRAGPGDSAARREFVRGLAPAPVLELFERRLPAAARAMAAGRAGLAEGVALYHLILEGVVLSAGQRALLAELADGALPEVRCGVELVERDERWHVGFGLRCLLANDVEARLVAALVDDGEAAVDAWGPAVPAEIRSAVVAQHRRRLGAIGLLPDRDDAGIRAGSVGSAPRDHAGAGRTG